MAELPPVTGRGQSPPPILGEEPFYGKARDSVDLRALADVLLKGRWIILAAILAVTIPALLYSLFSPSLYRSYSILLVERTDSDLAAVLPESVPTSFWREQRNLSNELLILDQSMPLALRVAERLMEVETIPGTDTPLTVLAPMGNGAAPTLQDVAFRLQDRYVRSMMESDDADAIRVISVSTSPQEAALIANAYSELFAKLTQDNSRSGASASREFLEGQVEAQAARLSETDEVVEQYMLREGAVALEEGASRLVDQIASLDAQRDQTLVELQTRRAELRTLQAELARLEGQLGARLTDNLDDELTAVRAQVQTLRQSLETLYLRNPSLRTDATPADPEVARLRRELARAEAEQEQLAGRLARQSLATGSGPGDQASGFTRAATLRGQISTLQVSVRGLEAQLEQVRASIGQYERELDSIPAQSIELAQLQRQRQAAERLYGALEQNLQQARVAEQSQLGYAQVIRPAYPADQAFMPRRMTNLLLALFSGLVLGCALAVAKVRLDHHVHTPDDIATLGLPLIGTVPSITDLIEEEYDGSESIEINGRLVDTHIVSLLNPMATASESYRAIRTNLQFSRPDLVLETILVTSSNPSEGKSVTAANLGVVFAQAGRRVLLVDADLRRPTIHRKLGIPREPGLIQQIFSDKTIEVDGLHQLADDLYVLPAGSLVPNPSEMLGSKRMRDLIDEMRGAFDVIIFDAPPVLAATDAVLLSTQCDATLLVTRAGQTKDFHIESAISALQSVGTKVSGLVLNAFDVRETYGYRYKYAYRYESKYSYGADAPE